MKILEKMKENRWKLLTLLVVLVVQCCFVARKEGYHMDELLSFQLSNAEYNPWIVPTQPVGRLAKFIHEEIDGDTFGETLSNLLDTGLDVIRNRGNSRLLQYKADVYTEPVWITREQFHDYVTVDSGDDFNYLSVYFNVKDDNHPPVHFMLLHTMSSVFRNTVAPFLGCVINILAILGCCICFFRLGALLESGAVIPAGRGQVWGICAGLLYGLSSGAIATALLIRMYGVMTFFCVALFCLHLKKWLGNSFDRKNRWLFAVTALGFWTQYFFLFYCFGLALVTVGLLIRKKRYGELKKYILTMMTAAVVGVAVFPFALSDVFSSGRGVEALENLSSGLAGYGTRLSAFGSILLAGTFGRPVYGLLMSVCLAAALGAVLIWRRKKGQAVAAADSAGRGKGQALGAVLFWRRKKGEGQAVAAADSAGSGKNAGFWLMLVVPVLGYFLLAARVSPYLVDRYIMALFPFVAMVFATGLTAIFRRLPDISPYWMLVPALLPGIVNVAAYDGEYLYRGYASQLETAEQYGELPCICVYDGVGYYYNLPEFTEYEKTLLVTLPELEQRQDTDSLMQLEQLVVLRKSLVEEASLLEALEGYGFEVETVLLPEGESVHGDTVYLCVRKGD